MSVPGVLRALLGTLNVTDGRSKIAGTPRWLTAERLPELMGYLADNSRRGPVYVISQGSLPPHQFERWARELTWHLTGLGGAFLLDCATEAAFNETVGSALSLPRGGMRTYFPGVVLDNTALSRSARPSMRESRRGSEARIRVRLAENARLQEALLARRNLHVAERP
ncbi:hypothetical protein [Amycolatopsis sp. 3B14]|uniref:hypothetical protein n=1 Tax=Amycolatopsis sp. 3B14 TaxID=3243600 RepID=UPI003D972D5C